MGVRRLEEAPEYAQREKKRVSYLNVPNLVALQRVDHYITRAINFWVKIAVEGYIVEFATEDCQFFLKAQEEFRKERIMWKTYKSNYFVDQDVAGRGRNRTL